jgi:hypothetical protein
MLSLSIEERTIDPTNFPSGERIIALKGQVDGRSVDDVRLGR